MHDTGDSTATTAPPPLPRAAWVLAWSFVVGQLFSLVVHGTQPEERWPLSMLLGVLVVVFFSHGVLRARMVRFWIVAVLLAIAVVAYLLMLVDGAAGPSDVVDLVLTVVQLGCLVQLHRSPWFAWQRTRPAGGPSLTPLMLLATVVGLLAGIIGTDSSAVSVSFDL